MTTIFISIYQNLKKIRGKLKVTQKVELKQFQGHSVCTSFVLQSLRSVLSQVLISVLIRRRSWPITVPKEVDLALRSICLAKALMQWVFVVKQFCLFGASANLGMIYQELIAFSSITLVLFMQKIPQAIIWNMFYQEFWVCIKHNYLIIRQSGNLRDFVLWGKKRI